MLIDFQPFDRRRSLALSFAKARDIAKASLLVSALWVAETTSQPAAAGWSPQIPNASMLSTITFAARSMRFPYDGSGPAIGLVLPVRHCGGNPTCRPQPVANRPEMQRSHTSTGRKLLPFFVQARCIVPRNVKDSRRCRRGRARLARA